MRTERLYYAWGKCCACGEPSRFSDPCHDPSEILIDGKPWSLDTAMAADAEAGLACDCNDCFEGTPCGLDCDEGDSECNGCKQARLDHADTISDIDRAQGRKS